MKRKRLKWLMIVICMVVSGISYGCKKNLQDNLEVLSEPQKEQEIGEVETIPSPIYCYVHISGEVNQPGVYQVEENSRIFQVVEMAGGFTQDAAKEVLNLAERVEDGMKIVVFSEEEVQNSSDEPFANENFASSKVNLNRATKEQLMTLSGVGESKANDIIRYREEKGGFKRIEDIMNIPGIKDAVFQKIKDQISV